MINSITQNKKYRLAIICIIIIIGVFITLTKGLNFDLKYQASQKVELYIKQEFETKDIKAITDEVLKEPTVLQKIEVYQDMVRITAKQITEEQKENLVSKINEKYETEIKAEEITIEETPQLRGRDIVKPYIVPVLIAGVIIIGYFVICYHKLGIAKVIGSTILAFILVPLLYVSILAITRLPVNEFTMPIAMLLYIMTLWGLTKSYEKEKEETKQEENTQKNAN